MQKALKMTLKDVTSRAYHQARNAHFRKYKNEERTKAAGQRASRAAAAEWHETM